VVGNVDIKIQVFGGSKDASKGEVLEFVETLRQECANKTSHYLRPRGVVEA
jgi:hypothetical protein